MARTKKTHPNTRNGAIWFEKFPPDHARQAFDEGYYIEALQVLHAWLEAKLQEWLLIGRHGNIRGGYRDVWASASEISLLQAAKTLFVLGRMPKTTFDKVCQFNSQRNKVIHRIFHESYESGLVPISFSKCEAAFRSGEKLAEKLEGHLARLATRGKPTSSARGHKHKSLV